MRGGPFSVMRRALVFLLAAFPLFAADNAGDVVKYRQAVMKAMGAHMTAMSLVVRKQVSDRSQLVVHAAAVRDLSAGIPLFFPRGTGSDKTKTAARNEIWQQSAQFENAAATLRRDSQALAEAARRGDAAVVAAQFENVANACAACHRTFRQKDSD
jgi:cytochrome c556